MSEGKETEDEDERKDSLSIIFQIWPKIINNRFKKNIKSKHGKYNENHTLVHQSQTAENERQKENVKSTQRKKVIFKLETIKWAANFITEMMEARRQCDDLFNDERK